MLSVPDSFRDLSYPPAPPLPREPLNHAELYYVPKQAPGAGGTMRARVERAILERDGSRACFYCGTENPYPPLCLDHVVAAAKGGSDNVENLVFACGTCNLLKGRSPGWFFMFWRVAKGGA